MHSLPFETESHEAQAAPTLNIAEDPELLILLRLPPDYWDYSHA